MTMHDALSGSNPFLISAEIPSAEPAAVSISPPVDAAAGNLSDGDCRSSLPSGESDPSVTSDYAPSESPSAVDCIGEIFNGAERYGLDPRDVRPRKPLAYTNGELDRFADEIQRLALVDLDRPPMFLRRSA